MSLSSDREWRHPCGRTAALTRHPAPWGHIASALLRVSQTPYPVSLRRPRSPTQPDPPVMPQTSLRTPLLPASWRRRSTVA